MISITVRTDAMKRALEEYALKLAAESGAAVVDAMGAAETVALARIRAQTKRRTGALEDDWQHSIIGPFTGSLRNLAKHSPFIDEGTRPHEIRAVRAKALRFEVGGETVFRQHVNHPGTEPRPFVSAATLAGEAALQLDLQYRADALAHAFAR